MPTYTILTPAEENRRALRRKRRRDEFIARSIVVLAYMLFGVALYWMFVGIPNPVDPWLYFYAILWPIPMAWYAFLYFMLAIGIVGVVCWIWSRVFK